MTSTIAIIDGKKISLLVGVNEELCSVRESVKSLPNKLAHHSAFTTALN